MRTKKITAIALSLLSCALFSCQQNENLTMDNAIPLVHDGSIVEGSYIVTMTDDILKEHRMKISLTYEQKIEFVKSEIQLLIKDVLGKKIEISQVYFMGFVGFTANLDEEQLSKLKADHRINCIEQDRYIALAPPPGKGKGGGGDGGSSGGQQVPWGVQSVNGGVAPAAGRIAWILDTGIDLDHPDLNVNTSLSKSFIRNGDANDNNGHGSHVAGILGAKDNSIGVIGVAAGAELVSVQVLNRKGQGKLSEIIAGVQYVGASANSDDVANMSLGGDTAYLLDKAVIAASASCPFVLAAGNERDDAMNYSPARIGYNNTNIYTISAHTPPTSSYSSWPDTLSHIRYMLTGVSNYGQACQYSQPGYDILSCWKNGDYNTQDGTSTAAPHLSGLILIGYTEHPDSTAYSDVFSVYPDIFVEENLIPFHQ
jgi:hypothetical protein